MNIKKWKIEKNSPIPYYHQLERFIKQEIDNGGIKKGDLLPSEGDIAGLLKISVSVVRKAFDRLAAENIIVTQKGKRSVIVVSPKTRLNYIAQQMSLYSELKKLGFNIKTRVIENKIVYPSEKIKDNLKLNEKEKVVKISRIRSVDNKPMIFWISYLPYALCKGLESMNLKDKSLYQVLEEKYNLRPDYAEKTFEIIIGEEFECDLLKVPAGTSLIYIESLHFLENRTPLECYEAWHSAFDWKFTFHCSQDKL